MAKTRPRPHVRARSGDSTRRTSRTANVLGGVCKVFGERRLPAGNRATTSTSRAPPRKPQFRLLPAAAAAFFARPARRLASTLRRLRSRRSGRRCAADERSRIVSTARAGRGNDDPAACGRTRSRAGSPRRRGTPRTTAILAGCRLLPRPRAPRRHCCSTIPQLITAFATPLTRMLKIPLSLGAHALSWPIATKTFLAARLHGLFAKQTRVIDRWLEEPDAARDDA